MRQGLERSLSSEKGLSLIEVLLAAIILGIAVISVSYMFGTAGADISKLGNERVCHQVAQDEMERLLGLSYDDPGLIETSAGSPNSRRLERPPDGNEDPDGSLLVLWWVTDIDEPANGVGNDYKCIVLQLYDDLVDEDVRWPSGSLSSSDVKVVERVVTLTTIMAP